MHVAYLHLSLENTRKVYKTITKTQLLNTQKDLFGIYFNVSLVIEKRKKERKCNLCTKETKIEVRRGKWPLLHERKTKIQLKTNLGGARISKIF